MPKKLQFNKYSLLELGNLEEQTAAGVKRMLTQIWWYFVRSEGLDLKEYDYLICLWDIAKNENSPIWIWESWSNFTGIQPALCSDGSRCDEVESGYIGRKWWGIRQGFCVWISLRCFPFPVYQLLTTALLPLAQQVTIHKTIEGKDAKHQSAIPRYSSFTCVNCGIEIPLSLQCEILQYKILRNVEQSELCFFRPLYHKIGKHAFRCEVILWQIHFRVFIEPSTTEDWFDCIFWLTKTKKKCCQW